MTVLLPSPGTQDVMSIRAAILVDLLAGKTATEYAMIDQDELKTFVYRRAGAETIDTMQGRMETSVWTSERKGSDSRAKTWKYWYAPSIGYLPARAWQLEEGKTRLAFDEFRWQTQLFEIAAHGLTGRLLGGVVSAAEEVYFLFPRRA